MDLRSSVGRNFKKYFGLNENKNKNDQNLQDAVKAVLRGKSVALTVCVRKEERSKINLCFHLREPELEGQFKTKPSRGNHKNQSGNQ